MLRKRNVSVATPHGRTAWPPRGRSGQTPLMHRVRNRRTGTRAKCRRQTASREPKGLLSRNGRCAKWTATAATAGTEECEAVKPRAAAAAAAAETVTAVEGAAANAAVAAGAEASAADAIATADAAAPAAAAVTVSVEAKIVMAGAAHGECRGEAPAEAEATIAAGAAAAAGLGGAESAAALREKTSRERAPQVLLLQQGLQVAADAQGSAEEGGRGKSARRSKPEQARHVEVMAPRLVAGKAAVEVATVGAAGAGEVTGGARWQHSCGASLGHERSAAAALSWPLACARRRVCAWPSVCPHARPG